MKNSRSEMEPGNCRHRKEEIFKATKLQEIVKSDGKQQRRIEIGN